MLSKFVEKVYFIMKVRFGEIVNGECELERDVLFQGC